MKPAQVHAVKEPVGLMRQGGKRLDGTTTTHIFYPVAIETAGIWYHEAVWCRLI